MVWLIDFRIFRNQAIPTNPIIKCRSRMRINGCRNKESNSITEIGLICCWFLVFLDCSRQNGNPARNHQPNFWQLGSSNQLNLNSISNQNEIQSIHSLPLMNDWWIELLILEIDWVELDCPVFGVSWWVGWLFIAGIESWN